MALGRHGDVVPVSDDLTAFIAARNDEDEQWAKDLIAYDRGDVSGMLGISQRMLAEVEAKRAILAEHTRALEKAPANTPLHSALLRILKAQAAVWSGHPDYRQEWKP